MTSFGSFLAYELNPLRPVVLFLFSFRFLLHPEMVEDSDPGLVNLDHRDLDSRLEPLALEPVLLLVPVPRLVSVPRLVPVLELVLRLVSVPQRLPVPRLVSVPRLVPGLAVSPVILPEL